MRVKWICGAPILALLFAVAAPARAADNLDCASSLLDAKTKAEIFAAYRADKDIGEKVNEMVGKKFAGCMLTNDWSEAATESAMRFLFGDVLEAGVVGDFVKRKDISTDALFKATDRFFSTMKPEDVRKFADGQMSEEAINDLIQHLLADGAVTAKQLEEPALGRLIGEFAAARANAIYFRAAFARQ